MGLFGRQGRERNRNRPSGALSQADNPGNSFSRLTADASRRNASGTVIASPAAPITDAKANLPVANSEAISWEREKNMKTGLTEFQ